MKYSIQFYSASIAYWETIILGSGRKTLENVNQNNSDFPAMEMHQALSLVFWWKRKGFTLETTCSPKRAIFNSQIWNPKRLKLV